MKHPFNAEGVAAWQQSLEGATDQQLQQEANSIFQNFKEWLTNTFELEPGQIAFFDGLDHYFVQLISAQLAFAVVNRLPVKLTKPEASALRGTKLIRDKSRVEGEADGDGNVNASGEVEYEIVYE